MNHPSIQARPPHADCPEGSSTTNISKHIYTPPSEVCNVQCPCCWCAIFSSGCNRCRCISHRRHCGTPHGETCFQLEIPEIYNHYGIGISCRPKIT